MEATLSDSRISVVTSSTVGNTAKSSAFTVYTATSSTSSEDAILKVNRKSSTGAGNGSSIMASTTTASIGTASEDNGGSGTSCPAMRSWVGSRSQPLPGAMPWPLSVNGALMRVYPFQNASDPSPSGPAGRPAPAAQSNDPESSA